MPLFFTFFSSYHTFQNMRGFTSHIFDMIKLAVMNRAGFNIGIKSHNFVEAVPLIQVWNRGSLVTVSSGHIGLSPNWDLAH
jgi:hypothetical protein